MDSKQDWKVHTPAYDTAVETSWDGVDRSEFDDPTAFQNVHIVEHGDDVHLPVAHKEDGEIRLVYEGLSSAHDLAEQVDGMPRQIVDNARDILEMLREAEFPDREALDADSENRSLSEDDVSECISDKVDDGVPQEQAVAICLSEAEEGNAEPQNRVLVPGRMTHKSVLTEPVLVPDQLLYLERSTAEAVTEMLGLDGVHTHEMEGDTYYMPGETHAEFFEAVGEAGVQGLIEENRKDTYEVGDGEIDITPPQYMVEAAEAAANAGDEGLINSDCGTGVGDRRRTQILDDEVGPDVVEEFAAYLTSHEEDVTAGGHPRSWSEEEWGDGCGNAQYAKWGGIGDGRSKEWAQRHANQVAEARDEEIPYPQIRGVSNEHHTMSLEDPQFSVGDFVRWDFATGTSDGEIIDMTAEVGDSMSAGGNEFTIEEGDGPLYKMQEWDETEGEEGSFTNNVVKFEDALRTVQRPDAAPQTAPRNRSKDTASRRSKSFTVKGSSVKVEQNSEGRRMVEIPINATTVDRDGDLISEKGQKDMIRQLETGQVPLMPNHGVGESAAMYGFEDIFGKFVDGEMRDGTTVGTVELREGSDMADEMTDLLEQDMPVSFSVGFIPEQTEERRDDNGERSGDVIHGLDLMEVSAVGVPSNPDAVPQAMSEAVAAAKQAVKQADNDSGVLTERDLSRISEAVRGELREASAREARSKAEGDVSAEDLAGFMAAHFEGMELEDVLQAVDDDMSYVGELSLDMAADLLGQRMDVPGEMLLEVLADAADMETDIEYGPDTDEEDSVSEPEMDDDDEMMSESLERTADKNQPDGNRIRAVNESQSENTESDSDKFLDKDRIAEKGEFWGSL